MNKLTIMSIRHTREDVVPYISTRRDVAEGKTEKELLRMVLDITLEKDLISGPATHARWVLRDGNGVEVTKGMVCQYQNKECYIYLEASTHKDMWLPGGL